LTKAMIEHIQDLRERNERLGFGVGSSFTSRKPGQAYPIMFGIRIVYNSIVGKNIPSHTRS